MTAERTIVIGAGMAGLSCARVLAASGHDPLVLDKGRGSGGRLATRRTPECWQFDHGAQYVRATSGPFRAVLEEMSAHGAVAPWRDGSGRDHDVGVPGMSALAKHLARGLDVRHGVEVDRILRVGDGWEVRTGTEVNRARRVILTAPAPQIGPLIGRDHALARRIATVRLAPCLTLMVAFGADGPKPGFVARRDMEDPIAWIAENSSKPGRPGPGAWVAQAGPAWSAQHLARNKDEVAQLMLPMVCARLGADPATAIHCASHRWRYAMVTEPLGQSFARDETGTLYLGGDWCLGARVEAAWTSGTAIARDILAGG